MTHSLGQPFISRYLPPPFSGLNPSSLTHDLYSGHPYPPTSPTFSGPKTFKIDLPRFFGEDPYDWLAMAEEFLDYHEIAEH
ncbi:hypothetical protein ACFX15_039758 [Malus domestica]